MSTFLDSLKSSLALAQRNLHPKPEGERGLQSRGYKEMVGGMWDEIGELQFEYMRKEGLCPEMVFCDVACGSFRAGRFFIDYLNPGNYLGIDKQRVLVDAGMQDVLSEKTVEQKKPEIVISENFAFNNFSKNPEMAIANSLFTHLKAKDIKLCLRNLFSQAAPGCRFYATFFETKFPVYHFLRSHSSRKFLYTRDEMRGFGDIYGWHADYIGDWNHPRQQMMIKYTKPV